MALIEANLDNSYIWDLITALINYKYVTNNVVLRLHGISFTGGMMTNEEASITYEAKRDQFAVETDTAIHEARNINDIYYVLSGLQIKSLLLVYTGAEAYETSLIRETQVIDNYTQIFSFANRPLVTESVNDQVLYWSTNTEGKVQTLIRKIPIIYNDLKEPINHGVEGCWYIRKDDQPLYWRYWLWGQLVDKAVYEQYLEQLRQGLGREDILLPELRKLAGSFIG